MDPANFISLAVKLSNSAQEAELRTAVSRAYYGAFHAARELVEKCGVGFPPKELFAAEIHAKVRYCLANSDNGDAALIANKLSDLRSQRNYADYDLKSDKFSAARSKNVTTHTQLAIQIVDAIQQCASEPTFGRFKEKVRTYASNVLRLPVHDQ